jgi:hypothetical protein
VPGIIGAMENGRLAADAVVERCDQCERYPTDAAALAKLQELGLAEANGSAARSFSVHCYALVRVKFPGVVADDPRSAARQVLDRFDWDVHGRGAEYADEISELLVDFDGDADFQRSLRFDADLKDVDAAVPRGAPWLLVISNGSYERIEVCASHESGFRLLHEYVREQWEGTFGDEPIDADPKAAVQRFFDVGPVSYTLEERSLL